MSLQEVKIEVAELRPGMYVSRLDRPWLDTPFPLQGMYVSSDAVARTLAKLCRHVFIDVARSDQVDRQPKRGPAPTTVTQDPPPEDKIARITGRKPIQYPATKVFSEEVSTAAPVHQHLSDTVREVMDELHHSRKLDVPSLREAVNPMVDSILRNPDAFVWLARLKKSDAYSYHHAISCSVLMVAFGRHLGLPRLTLRHMALGGLLFDVGKLRLPRDMLGSTHRFTDRELKLMRDHVPLGLELLADAPEVSDAVREMMRTHHERHAGGGYPYGLAGDEIPLLGRIAGIVDTYDALISLRPFADPLSSRAALEFLYDQRNGLFSHEVVEQFIQVIGIYPVGTLVELTDGRVGSVIGQYQLSRLRPCLMILMDGDKRLLDEFYELDLRKAQVDRNGAPLHIAESLKDGAYGLRPDELFI